jgi:hypothetical protein
MSIDKNWRRADLGRDKASRVERKQTQGRAAAAGCVKARVTAQYLPGEPSPYNEENQPTNTWRVEVIPADLHGEAWAHEMKETVFTIMDDWDIVFLTYGTHGLILERLVKLIRQHS